MVIGDGQKFPSALIVPSFDVLRDWCARKNIHYTDDKEMILSQTIIDRIQKEMDTLNEHFAQYERIKKFALMPRLWSINEGELTPTLKVKRKIITAKNSAIIEKLYL